MRRIVAFRNCFVYAPKTYVKDAGLWDVVWVGLAQDGDRREKERERDMQKILGNCWVEYTYLDRGRKNSGILEKCT
jgi:hypothetical protein